MQQKEDDKLEDFIEMFLHNQQKTKPAGLNDDAIKIIFLRGIRDEYVYILNLMGSEYLLQLPLANIYEL